jgi:phosphatidylserine/phosphatidylglycerophosphate/cardiolipin synthase-like enzyme
MTIPHPVKGSYPVRTGNAVRPLVDGGPAFQRIGEAMDRARHSLWLTVAFYSADFTMPGGRGSLFDVLDRAVARGLDVRVIFWRPNPECPWGSRGSTFEGTPEDHDLLGERGSTFRVRWDRAHGHYLHHQKSWLIDAGQPSEVAFVGGINLTARATGEPGHPEGHRHDAYVEVSGPAATDVHHNFVQRWNEASERLLDDGRWGHDANDWLPFPTLLSNPRGSSVVQIQRNVHAGRYTDGQASPAGTFFEIADGERTIFDQYLMAIGAAREAIYIENQAVPIPSIASAIEEALKRGIEVVILVPAQPEPHVRQARRDPSRVELFDRVARLGQYPGFSLVGIAAISPKGERRDIYVHGKIMLVDDEWATIGSCNLHSNSLYGHTEMNASIWDATVVRALRCELLSEHLRLDTGHLDAREALQLYQAIARHNRRKREADDPGWQGLAYTLDPATYGE